MSAPKKANARRQPGERVNGLTDGRRLQTPAHAVNSTYGPPELCAWQVEPSVFWIQTTEPRFSRKLEKRQDTRRVGITGINHFRRTFEVRGTWRKIRRIIDRYLVSAGDQLSPDFRAQSASKERGSITIAARSNRRSKAVFVTGGAA
jgi:hypothetical protein